MAPAENGAIPRFTMICRLCDRPVIARESWVGEEVHCPHCESLLCVPPPSQDGRPVRALGPNLSARRCFNFACPACECLLEAHTGMSGHSAICPTCAARFEIPYVDGRSGRARKAVLTEPSAEPLAPVHAYGASGAHAPRFVTDNAGQTVIQCPHCNAHNEIDADTCLACGTPFTMESAPTVGKLRQRNRATWSITLGVIALPLFPFFIPGVLAVWLGLSSAVFADPMRRSSKGLVGLILGLLSLIGAGVFWYVRLKP